MRKNIKISIFLIAAVLLAGMVLMILNYQRAARERAARISQLSAQAKSYEAELTQLKREQELQELRGYVPADPGAAVVAFRIGGEAALAQALEYSETYRFPCAILVNVDDEGLEASLWPMLENSGLNIIFSCVTFTEDTETLLRAAMEAANEWGCESTRSFLLRASCDTAENRRRLSHAGIDTLFLYGDSLSSTVEEDFIEMNFSYVSRSGYTPASRLKDLRGSEQGLLFAIDLVSTTMTEKQISDALEDIHDAHEDGYIRIGSVSDAVKTVETRWERAQALVDAYLQDQAQRDARIAELQGIIREIYSHWDD